MKPSYGKELAILSPVQPEPLCHVIFELHLEREGDCHVTLPFLVHLASLYGMEVCDETGPSCYTDPARDSIGLGCLDVIWRTVEGY